MPYSKERVWKALSQVEHAVAMLLGEIYCSTFPSSVHSKARQALERSEEQPWLQSRLLGMKGTAFLLHFCVNRSRY